MREKKKFGRRSDLGGEPFDFPTYQLNPREYAKIVSEISTNYARYDGERFCVHYSFGINGTAYRYYFENHGYNDYNIVSRQRIK